jgi:hypothetical protein
MIIKSCFSPALLIFLLASCSGLGRAKQAFPSNAETEGQGPADTIPLLRKYVFPPGLEFLPGSFSPPAAAPGVGSITRTQADPLTSLTEDAKRAVTESFRAAYVEGLFRGLSLEGTLGGDQVHSWPPAESLSPTQNWRSRETAPNSWGVPSLVLAVRAVGREDTHVVRGRILDQYGKSGGKDRANGAAGYGAPLGEEFLYRDGIAQWFDYGLIRVDAAGRGFFEPAESPELPPSAAGPYGGDDGIVREHFQQARQRGAYANLPELRPDAPMRCLDFPAAGAMPAGTLYFQTFNRGSVLLLLPQAPDLPFRIRILAGTFLDAFLADAPETDLAGRLLRGIDRYGLPLTGAYPEPEGGAYREVQRFTRGWIQAVKPSNISGLLPVPRFSDILKRR